MSRFFLHHTLKYVGDNNALECVIVLFALRHSSSIILYFFYV